MTSEDIGNRTVRQEMIALLQREACGLREISQALRISEKEAGEHLAHIRRSLSSSGGVLTIDPAECLACGFVFKDRQRFSRPGRCPRCRKTRISLPRFFIR
jgi:predicted Zn-ribbon and HTH transcriptional regulator